MADLASMKQPIGENDVGEYLRFLKRLGLVVNRDDRWYTTPRAQQIGKDGWDMVVDAALNSPRNGH